MQEALSVEIGGIDTMLLLKLLLESPCRKDFVLPEHRATRAKRCWKRTWNSFRCSGGWLGILRGHTQARLNSSEQIAIKRGVPVQDRRIVAARIRRSPILNICHEIEVVIQDLPTQSETLICVKRSLLRRGRPVAAAQSQMPARSPAGTRALPDPKSPSLLDRSFGLPRIKIPEQSICLAKGQAAETLGQVDGCQVVVRLGRLLRSAERTITPNPLTHNSSTRSSLSAALEPVKSMQNRWTASQLFIKITMEYVLSTRYFARVPVATHRPGTTGLQLYMVADT